MKHLAPRLRKSHHGAHGGFTLIELMIAITISVFLIGGLLMMVQSTRSAFGTQNQLAQLQDNQRLTMTFMAEIIESAGYFPSPNLYTRNNVMPAIGVFANPGQAVFGTTGNPGGDTVTVRYGAGYNGGGFTDNIFNCRGISNTTVVTYDTFVNTFWVDTSGATPVLKCTFSSNTLPQIDVPLVNGVTNLTILYGVKHNPLNTGSCADSYLTSGQMAAADWSAVCSISMTATFTNPVNAALPIPIKRIIAVMNAAGVNT